ncbi:LOW QUALITY PROTEIN: interferon-induced protein 44-like [Haliotis rubra]|uniref:LOW QUALITY PROTEIN: interferon-induced protein 44-like n=1 Tax=Haliotis rubra TaxID=36100 RepID=UPI001EE5756B|nr:LOW QUALITY PROTEIN: interferon-induced protein 44-like [Haliotis rubra]
MSKLTKTYKDQLCTWIGGRKDFNLLYQATRDGCSGPTFHQKCDNKGAAVSVFYNTAGYVFGGYTSVSWSSDGTYRSDHQAFLFRLQAANSFQPQKYPVKTENVQHTVYHNPDCGSTFGGRHDLFPFSSTINKQNNYFQGNGYTSPNSYNMLGGSTSTFTGDNLQFTDVEVCQVTEHAARQDETPWRKLPEVKQKVLKSELETYSPPGKLDHVNILLLGAVGSGKSSYFNTINSIFQGRITSVACSGSAEHSLTTTYRLYKIKSPTSRQPLKVRLCDTRGLEDGLNLDLSDLMAIIDGHLPDRFTTSYSRTPIPLKALSRDEIPLPRTYGQALISSTEYNNAWLISVLQHQIMERTLTKKDQKQLNRWLNARKDFELLYKATRDGCSSTAFHVECDSKGPTVTVFYNTSDCVFGGYTSVSWDSAGAYKVDQTAFLFRLYFQGSSNPKQYPATNGNEAIYGHATYGPMFVACSNLNCYDVEVYSVKDGSILNDDPWRQLTESKSKVLKSEIETYSPIDGVKVGRVNILLVGAVGAGKSSYFNTMNSIFRGHVTSQACSGSAEHSLTTHYRKYKVRSPEGKPLKFRLCDTRGLEEAQGMDAADVVATLDGHLPDKYMFNPALSISPDTPGYKKTPKTQDMIHCVAFVIDGCSVDVFPDKILQNMKAIQQKANQRGIPQVVILTKVDKACPHVEEDPGTLFYSPAVSELVEQVSQLIGLPRAHVLPVKNYEKEMELVDNVDVPALISLRQMLRFADDYLYNFLDEEDKDE